MWHDADVTHAQCHLEANPETNDRSNYSSAGNFGIECPLLVLQFDIAICGKCSWSFRLSAEKCLEDRWHYHWNRSGGRRSL